MKMFASLISAFLIVKAKSFQIGFEIQLSLFIHFDSLLLTLIRSAPMFNQRSDKLIVILKISTIFSDSVREQLIMPYKKHTFYDYLRVCQLRCLQELFFKNSSKNVCLTSISFIHTVSFEKRQFLSDISVEIVQNVLCN